MEKEQIDLHISLLRAEVVPALGCTEPIAVALAVARAREELEAPVFSVEVGISANIYKNGMGVGIPGTGRTGLVIASALGAVEGDTRDCLELLKHVDQAAVERALSLMETGRVSVRIAETTEKLYVLARVQDEEKNWASCKIQSTHSGICEVIKNGRVVPLDGYAGGCCDGGQRYAAEKTYDGRDVTVESIFRFIQEVDFPQIEFILESERLNRAISQEGLEGNWGLNVGSVLWRKVQNGKLGNDLLMRAMAMTAAASDARMAGCTTPVMSNSGSGNQGITATLPVVAAADELGSTREQLARALALSHLVAIHIKGYLGRLSALCGCVVASSGAGCGVAYLMGGGLREIESTIKNMLGNVTGMLCDGAKVGCALKVGSGVSSAVMSAMLAMEGSCISAQDGIIEESVEKTIQNLGRIGSDGMRETDAMILDIMSHKEG